MGEIVTTIVETLQSMVTGSVEAITGGFDSLFFTGEGAERTLSTLGTVLIIFFAVGMAVGLVYIIINIFKR